MTEKQILTAYTLKRQGKAYREIAQAVGLDPRTQHSQVVSALRYFVMGYQAAMRKMESASRKEGPSWTERTLCFAIGAAFNMAIAAMNWQSDEEDTKVADNRFWTVPELEGDRVIMTPLL